MYTYKVVLAAAAVPFTADTPLEGWPTTGAPADDHHSELLMTVAVHTECHECAQFATILRSEWLRWVGVSQQCRIVGFFLLIDNVASTAKKHAVFLQWASQFSGDSTAELS